jgi:hypothetical protein
VVVLGGGRIHRPLCARRIAVRRRRSRGNGTDSSQRPDIRGGARLPEASSAVGRARTRHRRVRSVWPSSRESCGSSLRRSQRDTDRQPRAPRSGER